MNTNRPTRFWTKLFSFFSSKSKKKEESLLIEDTTTDIDWESVPAQ